MKLNALPKYSSNNTKRAQNVRFMRLNKKSLVFHIKKLYVFEQFCTFKSLKQYL